MSSKLVIIPCGQGKVWDKHPDTREVKAKYAYTGAPFKVNREYAECIADRWVILSAKYGFIDPDYTIPGPYNVTFKKKSPELVTVGILTQQIKEMNLNNFNQVIGLGGKEYRAMIESAFTPYKIRPSFPFAGLPIGKAMSSIKKALLVQ
ncbi:MAG: hypothetical protein PHF24_06835 [Syntrophomonas sp.]|nr:hypothetical protein [Syntrophomonas sp.]